jgi:RNA polymerase sigma factor (sigma-70 family)
LANYATYSDEQLVKLLKNSDDAAFTEIYHRYWQQLFFVVHKRLQSASDSKEVIQNVFLNLWEKRTVINISSLPAYLAGMARYAVYRFWANEERSKSFLATVPSSDTTELLDIENKQFLEMLTKFSDTLPEKYRIIFISHKLLDQPLEQVAKDLGVSPRTAERYVSKVMEIMCAQREKVAFSFLLYFFL